MAYLFYLDGQLTDQPMNDKELSTSIRRTNGGIVITQDIDLRYNGNNGLEPNTISGYAYLKDKFDEGSCQEVAITIMEENYQLYTGVIKVPSIRFSLHEVIAVCKVQDNSFYAYLNNNKSIVYNLQSTTTKNGVAIIPPDIYEVDVFNGETGVYHSVNNNYVRGYRLYDAFDFVIRAISDNKVQFYSSFLQQLPEIFIFDGFALANFNTDPNVSVSFNKLIDELNKLYNVGFFIDQTDPDNPVFILEQNADLFTGVNDVEFTDIKGLESSIKSDNLYGTVRVGASNNPGGADEKYTLPANTSYFAWLDEVFTPRGQCNVDNELNLVNDFHISNNDVNYQINGGSSNNADDNFLIQCDTIDFNALTAVAVQYAPWASPNTLTPNAQFYNFGFINTNKVTAHGSSVQSAIFNTQAIGTDAFQAQNSQEYLLVSSDPVYVTEYLVTGVPDVVFSDVSSPGNFNGNGNYNIVTGEYTVPADGAYSFSADYTIDAVNLKRCRSTFTVTQGVTGLPVGNYANVAIEDAIYVTAKVQVYDALNVLKSETEQLVKIINDNDAHQVSVSYAVNVVATDVVRFTLSGSIYKQVRSSIILSTGGTWPVGFNPALVTVPLHPDYGILIAGNPYFTWSWPNCAASPFITAYVTLNSFIRCDGTPDSGITVGTNQGGVFENYEYTFNYNISRSDWRTIVANPTALFRFEKDGIERYGWIDSMKHNDWNGETEIKLITNNATTTQ